MMTTRYLIHWLIFLLCLVQFSGVFSQNCPVKGISHEEYSERRKAVLEIIDSTSALAMKAADASTEYENMHFRQDQDFLYLTGVEIPGCYILLDKRGISFDGVIKHSMLFLPAYSEKLNDPGIFSGKNDTLLPADEFRKIFNLSLGRIKTLYFSAPGLSFVYDWLNDKPNFHARETRKTLKQKYPELDFMDAGNMIRELREIKSSHEIVLIRKAIKMTGDGILKAMKISKPAIWEYELKAAVEYEMTRQGAEAQSFKSIVGSGTNSLILHYDKDNCQTKKGDLVVMDVGAQYAGYAADITRTIPVSGKFTEEQREIYGVVLQAQKEVIKMVRPGLTYSEMDRKATEILSNAGYKKYIRHGVTHPVGLDVHDVSSGDTLMAGMVITVEPGLYIPMDDKILTSGYHGFGIRIEDDILVTKGGYENLSKDIPKEPDEIEEIMK